MTCKRWDVVAVHYPFIEGHDAKKRPALIVSTDDLRVNHGIYWTAMITTAKAGARPEDVPVTNRKMAGLPSDCVVRISRLTSLSDAQISHGLGTLTTKDRRAVTALLRKYLP